MNVSRARGGQDVEEPSYRCVLNQVVIGHGSTLHDHFHRPPRFVCHLLSILQLTTGSLNTRAVAALVILGAGCPGSNAGVPVVGDAPLHDSSRKQVDGHR